jgi:hypothetical protein
MKSIIFISIAFLGGFFTPADQAPVALDDVCRAIGGGNVTDLAAIMDSEVELRILDQEDLYSRDDATATLTDFFEKFTPTSFGKVHQGASKSDDAEYCIGTLATNKGSFRVYIYVAKSSSGVLLQELRIDRN